MLPYKEIHVLDRNAEHHGVPTIRLMERAGEAVADVLEKKFDLSRKTVLVLCGTGNNGGDGFVAARYLSEICNVRVVLARRAENIGSRIATKNFARIEDELTVVQEAANLASHIKNSDIIVDALLGIGISGKIREPYRSIIKKINRSKKPVVSIDIPSGMGTNLAVKPKITVALHDKKEGQTNENSGQIIVRSIGIPEEAEKFAGPGEFVYYPIPEEDSHKGDNGRVLVVGGGPYTGAPALSGLAAYRIGADLVHIATPSNCRDVVAGFSPNFIVHPLSTDILVPEDIKQIEQLSKKVEAIVIGPGLGRYKDTLEAVCELLRTTDKPFVLDADAITGVAKDLNCLKKRGGVITPHAFEFKSLAKEPLRKTLDRQVKQVSALAKRTGFAILKKGPTDIISDGRRVKLNDTGHQAMTVGGTGDVLAGVVGGLLSKGIEPYNAARMAAFATGYAGEMAFKEKSYGLMPMDVIDQIPNVLREFL